jgi:hypothetical protein
MDATQFILQLLGLTCLIVGFALVLRADHYSKMFRDLHPHDPCYYLFGMLPLVGGLTVVLVHNDWSSASASLVTLVGWLGIVKGVVRMFFPEWAVKTEKSITRMTYIPFWAIMVIALGAVMTWMGFSV